MKPISRLLLLITAALSAAIFLLMSPMTAGAARTGLKPLLVDARFFNPAASVNIYVATTGSDVTGDGKTELTPYATVGRALKDIPNGFTSNPYVYVAAGTYAGNDKWILTAQPGISSTPSPAGGTVRVIGDCTTPTAVFSTTGSGTAVVSSAGGGQTGGVTKASQYTFAPTVTSGAIAAVTDGSHFLRRIPSGTVPSENLVLTSTSPNLVLGVTAATALTTASLCPYASIFTGSIAVSGTNGNSLVAGLTSHLSLYGLKFSAASGNNFFVSGSYMGASSILSLKDVTAFHSYFPVKTSLTTQQNGRNSLSTNLFVLGAYLGGNWGSVTGNTFRNTANEMLWLNAGISTNVTTTAALGSITTMSANTFEGTGTGIKAWNSSIGGLGTGTNSVDITGKVLDLHYGTSLVIATSGFTGKATVASDVMSRSYVAYNALWAITNVSAAAEQFNIGGAGMKDLADLPFIDVTAGTGQLARVSAGTD